MVFCASDRGSARLGGCASEGRRERFVERRTLREGAEVTTGLDGIPDLPYG